jgi:EmrB/QacA subfamily drug resistance transporter
MMDIPADPPGEASPFVLQPRLRLLIPLVVAFAFFLEQLDSTIITTAIPDIAAGLHETPLRLNLALTSYILCLAVFIPVSGWVADRFGMRRTFVAAIAIFTLGSMTCGAAVDLPTLVFSRIVQGFGGAMLTPVGRLILLRSFPRSELVSAMTYVVIPAVLGPVIGPLAGGIITTYASWRWIFYVNIPFGVAGMVLAWRFVPDIGRVPGQRFDWLGFLISGLCLALLEFGIENLGRNLLPGPVIALSFAAGATLGIGYVLYARRHANAVLDLSLLHVRTFRITLASGSLSRIGLSSVAFLLPLMLQIGFGLSPLQSGSITFVTAVSTAVIRPASVRLLRWFGYAQLLRVNTLLSAGALAAFALVDARTSHVLLIGLTLVFGMIRSIQFNVLQTLTYADISPAVISRATSLGSVVQQLSMGFGISLSATLLGLLTGSGTTVSVADFHMAFLAVAVISLLGMPGFLRLTIADGTLVSGYRTRAPRTG